MMEAVYRNQPAIRQLADPANKWCNIGDSVLLSIAGRLGTRVAVATAGHRIAPSPTNAKPTLSAISRTR